MSRYFKCSLKIPTKTIASHIHTLAFVLQFSREAGQFFSENNVTNQSRYTKNTSRPLNS